MIVQFRAVQFCWWVLLLSISAGAQGAVSLDGTRVIFDGAHAQTGLQVSNRSDHEVLLQAWLSDADESDAASEALPFVVTPHLWRMPARGKQMLRILYEGVGMPMDRESLLYLYVLEIPRRGESHSQQLSIAVRQRLNVFYRPAGLEGDPAETAQTLRWESLAGKHGSGALRVTNPTPFHASLQGIHWGGEPVSDYRLIAPGASLDLPLPVAQVNKKPWHRLTFSALTDYGGQRRYYVDLNCGADKDDRQPANAQLLADAAIPPKEECLP